jgi:hypothetical protein
MGKKGRDERKERIEHERWKKLGIAERKKEGPKQKMK